ncbi:MAG: hypothetical protein AAF617_06345, partial [Bacteroidota bacterium]
MGSITQKMGYVSHFGERSFFAEEDVNIQNPKYKYIYKSACLFNTLLPILEKGNTFVFNPLRFSVSPQTHLRTTTELKKFVLGDDSEFYSGEWYVHKSSQIPFKLEQKNIYLDALISPYKKEVNPSKVQFTSNIFLRVKSGIFGNSYDGFVKYRMLFPFEDYHPDKKLQENYALIIETENYKEFDAVARYLNVTPPESFFIKIKNKIGYAFSKVKDHNASHLEFLYNKAPQFVLREINEYLRWADLFFLIKYSVVGDRETAVLNLLESLAINVDLKSVDSTDSKLKYIVTKFLDQISLRNSKTPSVFEKIYDKLNDFGVGSDNFTALIQMLYTFWSLSSYSDTKYSKNIKEYTGGPETLIYNERKILGFYRDDYTFDFVTIKNKVKIKVTKKDPYNASTRKKVIGIYNLFHPIVLADIPKKGELEVPATDIIPAFYLKAIDDQKFWSNIEKGTWLVIDVLTTALGAANLYKLRHLRHLAKIKTVKTAFRLRVGANILEVTTGALNILLSLADENSEFAKKLRLYLFWLEMASLSVDLITERLLKKAAREALEVADITTDVRVVRHLAEIAGNLKDYSSRFARSVIKARDLAPSRLKKFEDEIKGYSELRRNDNGELERINLEHGMIYNEEKNLFIIHEGEKYPDYVDWKYLDDDVFPGSVLTHNHPNNSGLSLTDVEMFLLNDLKEIRAIGKNGDIF